MWQLSTRRTDTTRIFQQRAAAMSVRVNVGGLVRKVEVQIERGKCALQAGVCDHGPRKESRGFVVEAGMMIECSMR